MPSNKLTREKIIDGALKLTESSGMGNFSLRELAQSLDVKPASLYNHFAGFMQIQEEVALRIAKMLNGVLKEAAEGKDRDDAFIDAAMAYRRFADEHQGLYMALIRMPASNDDIIVKAARDSYAPMRKIIKSFGKDKISTLHFLRSFRAATHGFVELTANHFMQMGMATKDETYEVMIHAFLNTLKGLPDNEEI